MPDTSLDPRWLAETANRLKAGSELVDLVLRAGYVTLGPYAGKLRAVTAELDTAAQQVRTLAGPAVAVFASRLDLVRRALLTAVRFRCSEEEEALADLGVVADELDDICQELLLVRMDRPRAAGGVR